MKKLNLSVVSRQKVLSIQEFKQINEKAQVKIQQSLKYLAEFKKRVYRMRNQIIKSIIYRYCLLFLKNFDFDSFIENRLSKLQQDNSRRFLGKIEISNNKGTYKGEAENGFPEGRGVFKKPDGSVYDGEFKGGQPEGRGVYKYLSGAVYDGELKGGKPEGRGVSKYPSGAVYDGEFKGGKPEGRGVYKDPYGAVYDGEFKGGKPEGSRVYKDTSGAVYD